MMDTGRQDKMMKSDSGISVAVLVEPTLEYFLSKNFTEGLASVCDWHNNRYGYIDKTGQAVVPFIHDFTHGFSEGLAVVKADGMYGFIDKASNMITPAIYDYAGHFSDGVAFVKDSGPGG